MIMVVIIAFVVEVSDYVQNKYIFVRKLSALEAIRS